MIKYGLISETDGRCLEKTIDLICASFNDDIINITEVGVYGGDTGNGMCEYLKLKNRLHWITGIDNFKDNEPIRFPYNTTIRGNSNEVYNLLEDNSQHMIFVDGCHCFAHVISDFFCYVPKVKVGGFMCFHDTGKHISSFKDFQHGDKNNPDAYISVRKALTKIGLLGNGMAVGESVVKSSCLSALLDDFSLKKIDYLKYEDEVIRPSWELIFDEADETNEAGGICVFKKLH